MLDNMSHLVVSSTWIRTRFCADDGAMAVHGWLGLSGLSVATKYLVILAELAAERGRDFAIEYDQSLWKHIAAETVPVAEVAGRLRAVDDARGAALQHTRDRERTAPARRAAPAVRGGKGGRRGGPDNGHPRQQQDQQRDHCRAARCYNDRGGGHQGDRPARGGPAKLPAGAPAAGFQSQKPRRLNAAGRHHHWEREPTPSDSAP